MKAFIVGIGLFFFFFNAGLVAQDTEDSGIRRMIQSYKKDPKGPFRDIRWFCPDGTLVPPQERCPQPGGQQRARYKDEVVKLAISNHVFVGQILATTPYSDFWDSSHLHSRLKQYQLEKYLRLVDDGWVLRKAQFYRGAYQAEDEEKWGLLFLLWLLEQDGIVNQDFFLIRQAARDLPHQGEDNKTQNVRAVSKVISDQYAPFLDIRVKIHGQPDSSDLSKVIDFRQAQGSKLTPDLLAKFDELEKDLREIYKPVDLGIVKSGIAKIQDSQPRSELLELLDDYGSARERIEKLELLTTLLFRIRLDILSYESGADRLTLLDASNHVEQILFKQTSGWKPGSVFELMTKINLLARAAAGAGFVELWEWEKISGLVSLTSGPEMPLDDMNRFLEAARRQVEWGSGMVRAHYQDVVDLYNGFEPLAEGFLDDRVRGSILLPLGESVGRLGDVISREASWNNQVLDLSNQSQIRGINPGYALGEFVVITTSPDELDVSGDKIYAFNRPPADLKPVAGIATVTEGNMVSHVQLLARNLGIPNAVITMQNLNELKQYAGQKIFYAVSNKGTVIMKSEAEMSPQERGLFVIKKRDQNKVLVPVDRIQMEQTSILDLRDVGADDSGILCGPKAANLGQLKKMFPDHVVDGLVIPFGIFKVHFDQTIPGREYSYWELLRNIFNEVKSRQEAGENETSIESHLITELENFRSLIQQISFTPEFMQDLRSGFRDILGKDVGDIPVFLRSDTNMEDLKDFTGAGLNLTIFNAVDEEKILQGIRNVWASPYSERSYKWRQKFLLNPESVYPSILIIPSVDVDHSGVVITKGIISGDPKDLTIAFNRGAGGAVEGQAAESYLVRSDGSDVLISPSREPLSTTLPTSGGVKKVPATFEKPILSQENIDKIRGISTQIERLLEGSMSGPYDVELGFKNNRLWLFQIRPFVENKVAVSSSYLESISPGIPGEKTIHLQSQL